MNFTMADDITTRLLADVTMTMMTLAVVHGQTISGLLSDISNKTVTSGFPTDITMRTVTLAVQTIQSMHCEESNLSTVLNGTFIQLAKLTHW